MSTGAVVGRREPAADSTVKTTTAARPDCASAFQGGTWKVAYASCLTEANQGGSALVKRSA